MSDGDNLKTQTDKKSETVSQAEERFCIKVMCDGCGSQYTSAYRKDLLGVIDYIVKQIGRPEGKDCTHRDVRVWDGKKQIYGATHQVGNYVGYSKEFEIGSAILECKSCGKKYPKPEDFEAGEIWVCSDCEPEYY